LLGTIISIPLILLKGRPAAVNEDTAEDASLRHIAVPFGPFLVLGAIAYIFVSPWLLVSLAQFWSL
jgi:prepilin signal peptidase PulO-like enzyme (type II secretory pathway)